MAVRHPAYYFRGPFVGLDNEKSARNVSLAHCADCDNCVVRDGHVTQRDGLDEAPGGGTVGDDIKSVRYVDGKTDYAICVSRDQAYVQRYNENYQPEEWTKAESARPGYSHNGALEVVGFDTFVGADAGVLVYRNKLDNCKLEDAGMEAFTEEGHSTQANGYFYPVAGSNTGNLNGVLAFYASRYNANTGMESNALLLRGKSGEFAFLYMTDDLTDKSVLLTIDSISAPSLKGNATHIRIYMARADGLGYAGLIAEVEFDEENNSTFTYEVGLSTSGDEDNGGSTYDEADDDTDYTLSPPTMNGLPPASVAMAYWQGRMFYATDTGQIYFSQSDDEQQGGREAVPATSYRSVPNGEQIIAMRVYRDFLFVFTNRQIHRMSGTFNSLTNSQVAQGVLGGDGGDLMDPVEESVGCISRDSLIEMETPKGGMIFFAGNGGLYMFNGMQAIPLLLGTVQREYFDRVAAVVKGGISAAHVKNQNLVVFCFKDYGMMCYDYLGGGWVLWDTFPIDTGNAARIGPISTRTIHGESQPGIFMLRQDADGSYDAKSFVLNTASKTDDGENFVATWTAPNLDVGAPARNKLFNYMIGFFQVFGGSSGSVKMYVLRNGDSTDQVPIVKPSWTQSSVGAYDPRQRLGFRGKTCQPVFELASGNETHLLGFSLDASLVGRR